MGDLTMKGKQELIRAMNAGIIATDAKDVYSCGMRNGIRWCRALLEDDPSTPNFEDPSQYAQPEQRLSCKNCVHLGHGYMMPCKNCKRNQMLPDWYEVETERKKNE